jgi:replication factor C subunit 1
MKAMQDRPSTLGRVKEVPVGQAGCLKDLTFVITGVLDSLERDEAKTLIERYGGRVTGSVSGKTSYLLLGEQPGESKIKKADTLPQVKRINEDELFDLIRNRSGHSLSAKEQDKASAASSKQKTTLKAGQAAAQGVTAAVNGMTEQGKDRLRVHGKLAQRAEDMLWVDKHRPMRLSEIIGNPGLVDRLSKWLKSWDATFLHGRVDKSTPRAVLISGAPGLGKVNSTHTHNTPTRTPQPCHRSLHSSLSLSLCCVALCTP